ncbi:MAG: glycosyltransferase family 2 protein [Candidatus Sumerlaeia bacterium]|nr:glycosyltransferase family 2 protein [Candidatus Sumerlaeia bacterium]
MLTRAELLFLTLLLVPAVAVFLYPLAASVWATLRRSQRVVPGSTAGEMPPLTVIVSAYNEEDSIAARLKNLLSLDYPADRLDILVVSDGSTDRTNEVVSSFLDSRVRLLALPTNVGKSAALTLAMQHVHTELLVCTDANSRFEPQALRLLVRWFADPRVGVVCGRLVYESGREAARVSTEESRYWRWDNRIKESESATGHMVAGNGSILAIRREFAEPIGGHLANDFAWLNIVRLRGALACFEADAVAWEKTAGTIDAEYRRRVRIMTRGLWAIGHSVGYYFSQPSEARANPLAAAGFFAQLVCKKLFRYLSFPALLLAFALTPLLPVGPVLMLGFAMGLGLGTAALIGLNHRQLVRLAPRLPNTLYHLAMASASLVALRNLVTARRVARWQPHRSLATVRSAPSATMPATGSLAA